MKDSFFDTDGCTGSRSGADSTHAAAAAPPATHPLLFPCLLPAVPLERVSREAAGRYSTGITFYIRLLPLRQAIRPCSFRYMR